MFVKICGLARREDILEVAAFRPDAMGFVLWPDSPRAIAAEDLIRWAPLIPPGIRKVGVFVDPELSEVRRIANLSGLDVIQLHRVENIERFRMIGLPIWKAIHADRMAPGEIGEGRVDAWVADTYSKDVPGGTGKTGNWEAIRGLVRTSRAPVLVAGGLNERNVEEAIRHIRPWGVDVSSGVEAEPGKKNVNSVREFIRACRKH
ncbi:MAG TPA: phosphoribosylanthranilate isomerase [Kiritimatiellia bacterium]|nr:phosphoribosylanthranilate isomerase [Kiritimatiellia bacterium]